MTDASETRPLNWLDTGLVLLFMVGIYTHYTVQLSSSVPIPSLPAGLAGLALLWRRREQITAHGLLGLITVVFLYTISILCADDLAFLGRRFHGLIQITYSLVIAYALFLTLKGADRDQVARLFLGIAVVILVGCLLEEHAGLRPISDAVRAHIYSSGVYESDTRDEILYGQVRPKFFASEPSAVTLTYTICSFVWLMATRARYKLPIYLGLIVMGFVAMRGPTLLLMLLLLVPYELFFGGRMSQSGTRIDPGHIARFLAAGVVLAGVAGFLAQTVYSQRLHDITHGDDPSFFYRVMGPILAAKTVIAHHPLAGAGLTGEPYVEDEVVNAYVTSPSFSRHWAIASAASELLINYFWLHWIYLGLFWGSILAAALSLWLRANGVRRILFCWGVWIILGQASGAYVGPITWAVFFLAAAGAALAGQTEQKAPQPQLPMTPLDLARWRIASRSGVR